MGAKIPRDRSPPSHPSCTASCGKHMTSCLAAWHSGACPRSLGRYSTATQHGGPRARSGPSSGVFGLASASWPDPCALLPSCSGWDSLLICDIVHGPWGQKVTSSGFLLLSFHLGFQESWYHQQPPHSSCFRSHSAWQTLCWKLHAYGLAHSSKQWQKELA